MLLCNQCFWIESLFVCSIYRVSNILFSHIINTIVYLLNFNVQYSILYFIFVYVLSSWLWFNPVGIGCRCHCMNTEHTKIRSFQLVVSLFIFDMIWSLVFNNFRYFKCIWNWKYVIFIYDTYAIRVNKKIQYFFVWIHQQNFCYLLYFYFFIVLLVLLELCVPWKKKRQKRKGIQRKKRRHLYHSID